MFECYGCTKGHEDAVGGCGAHSSHLVSVLKCIMRAPGEDYTNTLAVNLLHLKRLTVSARLADLRPARFREL
ncbi:uncharacterized [Tachysurus ichikawai]